MAGKFDFASTQALNAAHHAAPVVVSAEGANAVTIPGHGFLLDAEFHRSGPDLVLVGEDGREVVVTGYFAQAHPPTLLTPGGAAVQPELAAKLAGPVAPGQFAQADAAGQHLMAVGRVDKASGTVEVVHPDGTRGTLHVGDLIYKGDVIATKGDSAVGITFADASTFSLGKSGRMVIDELVYDPQAQAGQSALSVVKGAFSFASGHIAKTAPEASTIKTPVMTIGIRGTSGAGQADDAGGENTVVLLPDADGHVGQVLVFNPGGVQVLSTPLQLVALSNAFQAPPPPVIVPPSALQAFGSAIDNRPASPPANTPPHQIVPEFHPSVPQNPLPQQPAAPQPAGTQPAATQPAPQPVAPQPQGPQGQPVGEQPTGDHPGGGGQTNTGPVSPVSPFIPYTPNPGGTQGGPSTGPNILQQLTTIQQQTAANASQTGGNGQGNQQGGQQTGQTHNTGADTQTNTDNTHTTNNNTNTTPTYNGRAIDGYVANATVFRDHDNQGDIDVGVDETTTTDASGNYNLPGSGGTIVVRGGTDTTTGQALLFDLKAPAGSSVVTPLTTLVVAVSAATGMISTLAEAKVKAMLGLPSTVSLSTLDPIANIGDASAKEVLAATIQTVATINALTSAFGNSITAEDIIQQMAGTEGTLDLTDASSLTAFIADLASSNSVPQPTWLDTVANALSGANANLAHAIDNASSFASITSTVASATSTTGSLSSVINHVAGSTWDLSDAVTVKANLAILKAAGVTSLHVTHGTAELTAAQAADLHLTAEQPASVVVKDTGANFAAYASQLHPGCTSYVMTSPPPNGVLTLAQASALVGLVQMETGSYNFTVNDASGSADTLNVSNMLAAGRDWQFQYFVRDGNNLKMVLTDAAGHSNSITFTDHFAGNAVEFATDGTEAPVHLATNATGTTGDDFIFATNNSTVAAHWGMVTASGSGEDEFYYGGGANVFHGDGNDKVSFASSTDALIMSGPLNNSGNGSGKITHLGVDYGQTFTGIREITGTQGNDILYGRAPSSNETIPTNSSWFWIDGGKGNDIIHDGGAGTTVVDYSRANGSVTVNLATGTASGADGNDTLDGIHQVKGSAFNDAITGSASNDWIDGGDGNDVINGGYGYDTVSYSDDSSGVKVDLGAHTAIQGHGKDSLSGIESINGSDYADVLIGDDSYNWFNGRSGADSINGGAGSDSVSFETYGDEDAQGGVIVNLSSVTHGSVAAGHAIDGWGYTDTLTSVENVEGSEYGDIIYGSAESNSIMGGDGNDTIYGGGGGDMLDGGAGNDTIKGGIGCDFVMGDNGNDTIVFDQADYVNGGGGTDTLQFASNAVVNLSAVTASNMEVLDLTHATVDLIASASSLDALTGGTHTLYIQGGADDRLYFGSNWTKSGSPVTVNGHSYNLFTKGDSSLHLYVDTNIGNHAPDIDAIQFTVAGEPTGYAATDYDLADSVNSVTVTTGPAHGNLWLDADTGKFAYAATDSWTGLDHYTVTATDSHAATSTQTVYVVSQTNTGECSGAVFLGDSSMDVIDTGTYLNNMQVAPASGIVTLWLYLTAKGDGYTGTLHSDVGVFDANHVLTLTGTVDEVNAALSQVRYDAAVDSSGKMLGGGDTVHAFLSRDDGVWSGSFDVNYQAADTAITGGGSQTLDWHNAGVWSEGMPATDSNVAIKGSKVTVADSAEVASLAISQNSQVTIDSALTLNNEGISLQVAVGSTLTLADGADVMSAGEVDLAGTINLTGGTVHASQVNVFGSSTTVNAGGGTTSTIAGNLNNYGTVLVSSGSTLEMNHNGGEAILTNHGVLWGAGSVAFAGETGGGHVDNYGTIEVASSGADRTLTFYGSVTLENSSRIVLDIDNSGSECIDFDDNNAAALNGELVLNSYVTSASTSGVDCTLLKSTYGLADHFSFSNQLTGSNTAVIKYGDNPYNLVAHVAYASTTGMVTASDDHEVILGATGKDNIIIGIGTDDIVHGGTGNDTFQVSTGDFTLIDGHSGTNTLAFSDANATGDSPDAAYYDLTSAQLKHIDTLTIDDTNADVAIWVDLSIGTVLDANRDVSGDSSITVLMEGNAGAGADDVWLSANVPNSESSSDWVIEANATDRSFVATNDGVQSGTATVVFDQADTETAGNRVFALYESENGSIDVLAQVFDGPASYECDTGTDYVFGATDTGNTITHIGTGDKIWGGSDDDTFTTSYYDAAFALVDGGAGNDQLTLTRGEGELDFNLVGKLSGVESIVFGAAGFIEGPLTAQIGAADVYSAEGHAMAFTAINGNNTLELTGHWEQVAANSNSYTSQGATITVTGDITLSGDVHYLTPPA